jgi:hypothetical protein
MTIERAHPLSPSDLAGALVLAARKLGLEGTFLRIAAAELPDACWAPSFAEEADGAVMVQMTHGCLPGCPGAASHCLTALKAEQLVSRHMGRPYTIEWTRPDEEILLLRARPFD